MKQRRAFPGGGAVQEVKPGSQEGKTTWSKFWKVLCSSVTIANPRLLKQGLTVSSAPVPAGLELCQL